MENYNVNNFSPSDLIFLYLDGEASDTERNLLFKALANDEALQFELQDAISMKYATEKEAEDIVPAAALTNSIFGTLGISTIANVASQTIEVSTLSKVATYLKTPFMLVLNSLFVGGLLTYSAMKLNTPNKEELAENIRANNNSVYTQNNTASNSVSTIKDDLPKTINKTTENKTAKISDKKANKQVIIGTSGTVQPKSNNVAYQANENGEIINSNDFGQVKNGSKPQYNMPNILNGKRPTDNMPNLLDGNNKSLGNMPNIIKDNIAIDNIPNINTDTSALGDLRKKFFGNSPIDTSKYFSEPLALVPNIDLGTITTKENKKDEKILNTQNEESNYSLKLNGINNLGYISNTNSAAMTGKSFDNMQVTALYRISENTNIGLTLGNEVFPIYIKKNNEFVLTNNLVYLGAVLNYNLFEIEYAGKIRCNFNFVLAASQTSAINKTALEFTWFPDKKLGLNLGIEGFINGSNYKSAYEFSGKTNLYYGITYNF